MTRITYTNLSEEYAEALAALELVVFPSIDPSDLYDETELRRLAQVFPEGNFVALDDGIPVGMGLGVLVNFDFDHTNHALSDVLGSDGVANHDISNDWYYGTDISVLPEYRGMGIGRELYQLRKDTVQRLGKKGIVAGGVIPGYAEYLNQMTAAEYIDKVAAGELYDSTLSFQLSNGFEAHGPLPGYLDDQSVGHNAVLITWPNPDFLDA